MSPIAYNSLKQNQLSLITGEPDNSDNIGVNPEYHDAPDHPRHRLRLAEKLKTALPFCPDDLQLWFALVENHFWIWGITSDIMKYQLVVAQLDARHAAFIKDVIICPPLENKYQNMKMELMKKVSALDEERLKQILMKKEIDDQKPSLFLMDLQEIGDSKIPEESLKSIWVAQLPSHIQNVIESVSDLSLDILAKLADKLHEIVPTAENNMNLIESSMNNITEQLSDLAEQIERLTTEVQKSTQIVSVRRSRSKSLSQTRSCSKSPSKDEESDTETPIKKPSHQNQTYTRSDADYKANPICSYHSSYGLDAHWCTNPCDFVKNWEEEQKKKKALKLNIRA